MLGIVSFIVEDIKLLANLLLCSSNIRFKGIDAFKVSIIGFYISIDLLNYC